MSRTQQRTLDSLMYGRIPVAPDIPTDAEVDAFFAAIGGEACDIHGHVEPCYECTRLMSRGQRAEGGM